MKDIPANGNSIRCSSLPRTLACPASKIPPKTKISGDTTAADLGNAVHAVLAVCVLDKLDRILDVRQTAKRWNADPEQVSILAATALKWWREQLRDRVAVVSVETEMQTIIPGTEWWLTGHSDLIVEYPTGEHAIIDWKSGYVDWGYIDQLKGYVYLASELHEAQDWKAATVWPRLGEVKTIDITEEDIEDLKKRMVHAVQSDEACPGPHQCQWCPRAHECKAHDELVRSSATALLATESKALTAEGLASLYPQAKLLEKALKSYDKQLKAAVAAGPIPIGDGMVLDFREETREKILFTQEAVDAMLDKYNDYDGGFFKALEGAITVSKKGLQDFAARTARRCGEKIGPAKAEIVELMRGAGAVESKSIRKLVTRKEQ